MTRSRILPMLAVMSAVAVAAALLLAGCSGAGLISAPGWDTGDTTDAGSAANLASLSEVVQRNPSDPQAYNIRGSVYGQTGAYALALADFNKAVTLDPRYAQAFANRGLLYRQTNKLDIALADYNRALA